MRFRPLIQIALLTMVIGIHSGPALAADDPSDVDPANLVAPEQSPTFRETVKAEQWEKLFAKAVADLGPLDQLAASTQAGCGARLTRVDQNSQASRLSLRAGDVITHIDEQPVGDDFNSRRIDADQTIKVVSADGSVRTLTIHAGHLGFNSVAVLRPELVYLRTGGRKAAWDPFAAVGAACCFSQPDLAETAWYHAVAVGYVPDAISDFCGMQIAWRQGRIADAVAYCTMLESRPMCPAELEKPIYAYQLAIADFKIEQAIALRMSVARERAQVPAELRDYLQSLLLAHHALPQAKRFQRSPSDLLGGRASLFKNMQALVTGDQALDKWRNGVTTWMINQRAGPWKMRSVTDHFLTIVQMPNPGEGAENVEFVVHARIRASEPPDNKFDRVLTVGLVNCDQPEYPKMALAPVNGGMLSIVLDPGGTCSVIQGTEDHAKVQELPASEELSDFRPFTVRLIHALNRNEVWINQRRLLYLPSTENPKNIGFHVGVVGVESELNFEFSKMYAEEK